MGIFWNTLSYIKPSFMYNHLFSGVANRVWTQTFQHLGAVLHWWEQHIFLPYPGVLPNWRGVLAIPMVGERGSTRLTSGGVSGSGRPTMMGVRSMPAEGERGSSTTCRQPGLEEVMEDGEELRKSVLLLSSPFHEGLLNKPPISALALEVNNLVRICKRQSQASGQSMTAKITFNAQFEVGIEIN